MLKEQGRSTDDEQSQGAYDAALAGIEDGKRVLLECKQGSGVSQTAACNAINNQQCTTVIDAGIAGTITDKEVAVSSTTSGGNDLNLAYTCVIVSPRTPNYIGKLSNSLASADSSAVIPLRSSGGFNRVDIYWFSQEDATTPQVPNTVNTDLPILSTTNWPTAQPPVLRVQMVQYTSGSLNSADFDDDDYAHTLYLYPTQTGSTNTSFSSDGRRSSTASPELVTCNNGSYPVSGYSCYTHITMPTLAGGVANRQAYLRLTSIYNGANYMIVLRNGAGNVVDFDNVQPSIDATGRANDIFRRVESRVEVVSDVPYPRATVDINGNFCKTFSVGAGAADYSAGTCDPNS